MTTRKKDGAPAEAAPTGRFYQLQAQVAPKRREPYRLTDEIEVVYPTLRRFRAMQAATTEAEQIMHMLGDSHEAIEELYADLPLDEYKAFISDLRSHFFGEGSEDLPGGSGGS